MSIITQDPTKEGWERGDFPIVCNTCLGDNPYIRMTKTEFSHECKICTRPFTVFRWQAGTNGRHKKTEICQVCARVKNVCQVCILDLEYSLPVAVRDAANPESSDSQVPESEVSKLWMAQQNEQALADGKFDHRALPSQALLKMARTKPYFKRNQAHLCSFFVKGTCNRGSSCPYRHEMPEHEKDDPMAKQNIKDRYHGVNDPVAKKILARSALAKKPPPPDDKEITTLFVSGVGTLSEVDLRDHFYAYGELRTIKIITKSNCAFVTYTTRYAAERGFDALWGTGLMVKGVPLRVSWAKPVAKHFSSSSSSSSTSSSTTTSSSTLYPSMDPAMMGSRPEGGE